MTQRITEEKKKRIKELREIGYSYDNICRITKSSKKSVSKILKKTAKFDLQPLNIPSFIKKTKYPGYYITEDGKCYREPTNKDKNNCSIEINEYGLIYLNPSYRGNPRKIEYQYECINISVKDENGKFIKQIKKSIHQLVAETFIPNPECYTEILHLDGNNRNNHYKNLKWGSHLENMLNVVSPCTIKKSYTITDTIEGKVWKGYNLSEWVRENYKLLNSRSKNKNLTIRQYARKFLWARVNKHKCLKFKVEY